MSKAIGPIALVLSILALLIAIGGIILSVGSHKRLSADIETLGERVIVLETELSQALGYDITDDEAGNTSGSYDTSAYKVIKGTDLVKLSKGKKIVVWIGRQGCGYCSLYAPTIKAVGKDYDIKIHYIDLAAMYDTSGYEWVLTDEASYNAIRELETTNDATKSLMEDFGSTPMTLIVEDGKVIGGLMGAVDKTSLETELKNAGFKK